MNFALRLTLALVLAGSLSSAATSPDYLLDAISAQKELSAQNPDNPNILNDLANLLVMAGRMSEAEQTYRRAVGLAPANTTIRYNLALVLMELGDNSQAMDELLVVVESEPSHAWAHYQLGTLHGKKNHRMRALEHYRQAFALDWSLINPAINPHIVENDLASDAMLRAYLSQSSATIAPRLYQQPQDVAELLVPGPTKPRQVQRDPVESDTMSSRRSNATFSDVEEAEETDSDAGRVLTESDLQGRTVSPADPVKPRRKDRSRKRKTSSTFIEPPQETTSDSKPAGESQPTRSPTRQTQPVTGVGVTGVGGQPPASGSGTFFQPGTASTGRLDLELVPVAPAGNPDKPT